MNAKASSSVSPLSDGRNHAPYRSLYFELLNDYPHSRVASEFLHRQLELAANLECDLPCNSDDLAVWATRNVMEAGAAYEEYRKSRKAGAPRRYFPTKSHALYFLKTVAPAKLVDGSWLYGVLSRWDDPRCAGLIQTYLEELGDGVVAKNHVALFKKLLAGNHCEGWDGLEDRYYLQGAVQLALGKSSEKFLPEIIGFNLGYEQLPLHLLITAYELVELGIDPYYFTLHITIDNLDSGHAKKAVETVAALLPVGLGREQFYRRVINGYQLNALGESTCAIIDSFDLNKEVVKIFKNKAAIGRFMHSDRCQVGGRSINEWLASAERVPEFLQKLESFGWIKRHENPCDSKFWRLIQGDRPLMFGVFSPYEQQLIFDWIAGDYKNEDKSRPVNACQAISISRNAIVNAAFDEHAAALAATAGRSVPIHIRSARKIAESGQPRMAHELRDFNEALAALPDKNAVLHYLIESMSPAKHSTPIGLHATKIFKKMYDDINWH